MSDNDTEVKASEVETGPSVAFTNIEDIEQYATGQALRPDEKDRDVLKVDRAEPSIQDLAGEGEWISLRDGKKYLILPLLLDDLKLFFQLSEEIAKAETSRDTAIIVEKTGDAAHLILKQAYPNVKREDVGRLVSTKTVFKMIQVVMGITGLGLVGGNL
jgi:hypothetical protein